MGCVTKYGNVKRVVSEKMECRFFFVVPLDEGPKPNAVIFGRDIFEKESRGEVERNTGSQRKATAAAVMAEGEPGGGQPVVSRGT